MLSVQWPALLCPDLSGCWLLLGLLLGVHLRFGCCVGNQPLAVALQNQLGLHEALHGMPANHCHTLECILRIFSRCSCKLDEEQQQQQQ